MVPGWDFDDNDDDDDDDVTSQEALAGKPFCFTNQKEFYMEHYTRTVQLCYFYIVTLGYIAMHYVTFMKRYILTPTIL